MTERRDHPRRANRGLPFVLAALLASAFCVHPGVAVAQDPTFAAARSAFDRGVADVQANNFDDAVRELEESYRLRHVPIVQYNLGLAFRGQHRNVLAIESFERYLREHEPEAEASRLAAIAAEVARLRQLVATLALTVEPSNAMVRVDDSVRGVSASGVLLDPGRHTVAVSSDGYVARSETVQLESGQTLPLAIRLARTATMDVARPRAPSLPANGGVSGLVWIGAATALVAGVGAVAFQLAGNARAQDYDSRCGTTVVGDPAYARCAADYADLRQEAGGGTWTWIVRTLDVVALAGAAIGVVGAMITATRPAAPASARHGAAVRLGSRGASLAITW